MIKFILIGVVGFIIIWKLSQFLLCPHWLGWLVEIENPLARENQSASIIKHLNLHANITVADIGCGPGRVTIPLAEVIGSLGKVVAIDLQQEMLDQVKTKIGALKNIELRQQNINKKRLEESFYDYVLLVNVLGEIPHQKQALQTIFNGLRKDGVVSITETIFDPHFCSKSKVIQLLTSCGYSTIQTFGPWYSYTIHGTK